MKAHILRMLFLSLLLSYGNAFAGDLVIGNYSLVSQQRVTRTDYLYTYKADVTNNGADATGVTASLTSNSANTVVVTGILTFGDVADGVAATSSDTFSIRQNRSYPFDESALVWDVKPTITPTEETPEVMLNELVSSLRAGSETEILSRFIKSPENIDSLTNMDSDESNKLATFFGSAQLLEEDGNVRIYQSTWIKKDKSTRKITFTLTKKSNGTWIVSNW